MEKQIPNFPRNSMWKRALSFCIALCLLLSMLPVSALTARAVDEDKLVALDPGPWAVDGAWFAVYYFGDGEGWTQLSYDENLGLYVGEIPAGYSGCIFTRMNPGHTEPAWDAKWNQTADLVVPEGMENKYTVTGWNESDGTWSHTCLTTETQQVKAPTCTEPGEDTIVCKDCGTTLGTTAIPATGHVNTTKETVAPTCCEAGSETVTCACGYVVSSNTLAATGAHTYDDGCEFDLYTVAGEAGLCGYDWDPSNKNNMMTTTDGVNYTKTFTNVPIGNYQFKVTDGSWNNSWGQNGNNYTISVPGTADVTVCFNADTKEIKVLGIGYTPGYVVAVGNGSGNWLNGAVWDVASAANMATETAPGIYEITYTGVAKSDAYEFKFAADGGWDKNWGTASELTSGVETDAYLSGSNCRLIVSEDNSTVTLKLDLSAVDSEGNGAKIMATVTAPQVKTYTVTFDSKEGSAVEAQTVEEGKTASEPTAPTREGYTFGGWYTDEACTTQYDFSAAVTGELTLYAKWTEKGTKLYLKPNANWRVDNARFAVYYYAGENDNGWVSMTDSDSDGVYEVTVPTGYSDIIFCRMNPGTADNNWSNKWNQTANLTIPTDGTNCYTIEEGAWDGENGTWSTFPPADAGEAQTVEVTLHYVNTLNWGSVNLYSWYNLNGNITTITPGWPGSAVAEDDDGYFTTTYEVELPAGAALYYIFNAAAGSPQTVDLLIPADKIVDGKVELWVVPGTAVEGNYNCDAYDTPDAIVTSPVVDGMNVTFEYAAAEAAKVEVFGSWNNWASGTAMTKNAAGVWDATITLDTYGDYEYKFVVDGNWVTDPANSWIAESGNSAFRVNNPNAIDSNTITVNVTYYRADGAYADEEGAWNLYAWGDGMGGTQFNFTEKDGKMVTSFTMDGRSNSYVKMKTRMSTQYVAWQKEESEVTVDLSAIVAGTVNIDIVSDCKAEDKGSSTFTYTMGTDLVYKNTIKDVQLDYDTGSLTITTTSTSSADMFKLVLCEEDSTIVMDNATVTGSGTSYTLTQPDPWEWDLTKLYQYKIHFLQSKDDAADAYEYYDIGIDTVYSSDKFEEEFTYTGDDLGATYNGSATTFKVWAPTAENVVLKLYDSGSDNAMNIQDCGMIKAQDGVWAVTVEGDLDGTYYTYAVTVDGDTVEACDPYARTTGVNGEKAMVIDLDSTDPTGTWGYSSFTGAQTDAIIYELHVRDFSIDATSGVSQANRGKFLAFTETNSAAMQHLTGLGITHLHLLPIYDYGSVDERYCANFNWGYDPVNYNVPEGSYSTDPYNGATRVKEMKQMVAALHDQGISVVMDVVYNHVYDAGAFCFNQIVPGYFSRANSSVSGCGNDTASERKMVHKYIVDSVVYLAEEYKLDGFRFDLVGLLDVDTINALVEKVHAVNPYAVFYGEGWNMDGTNMNPRIDLAKQGNASKTPGFAYFSDSIRNHLAGSNGSSLGFVSGMTGGEEKLAQYFMAQPESWGEIWTTNPAQVIQYASCHDNYTLVDKLVLSTGKSAMDADIIRMNNLAAAIYMTSQGVPFIHAGEDFLREKIAANGSRVENSYNSPDSVNKIVWTRASTYADNVEYYKGLIAFRKANPILKTNSATTYSWLASNVIQFAVGSDLVLIFNGNNASQAITLPQGNWDVYINGEKAGTSVLGTISGEVSLAPISALALKKSSDSSSAEHTYGNDWSFNATHHWKECTCCEGTKQVKDKSEHSFVDGKCSCGAALSSIPTGWSLPGNFNGTAAWDDSRAMTFQNDTDTIAVNVDLEIGTHQFKVKNGGNWYGFSDMAVTADDGITVRAAANDGNLEMDTTEEGTYTFTYSISGKKLTITKYEEPIERINLSGTAMTLGSSLSLDFGINTALLENNGEGHYAVITRHYATGEPDDVVTVQRSDWESYSGTVVTASYTGLAAKEMCDEVEIVIYNAKDQVVSNEYVDSARGYAMRMLKNSAYASRTELLTLLVDMLNYGAAAQEFFGYNTTDLANAKLTDAQKAYATVEINPQNKREEGTGYVGTALALKNRILLDFAFDDDIIGSDFEGMYAIAAYTDHYGNAETERIDTVTEHSEGLHYVSVTTLAVADCDQLVTLKLYNSNGEEIATAKDSINGYVARQIEKNAADDIYVAIAAFGESAYNYFH